MKLPSLPEPHPDLRVYTTDQVAAPMWYLLDEPFYSAQQMYAYAQVAIGAQQPLSVAEIEAIEETVRRGDQTGGYVVALARAFEAKILGIASTPGAVEG